MTIREIIDARPAYVIAGLTALAVLLNVLLVEYSTNNIVTYADGTSTRSIQGYPIIDTDVIIADAVCVTHSTKCVTVIATIEGLFPRDGIAWSVAVTGGMVAPYLLLLASGYLAIRLLSGRMRLVVSVLSIVCGGVFLLPTILIAVLAVPRPDLVHLQSDQIRAHVLLDAVGIALLAGGIWLAVRAYRGVPPPQQNSA